MRSLSVFVLLPLLACAPKQEPVATLDASSSSTAAPAARAAPATVGDAMEAMRANFARVYFDVDASALSESSKEALLANVAIMQKHPSIHVMVEGHADERGTTDYNLALGERRAETVRAFMTRTGIKAERVRTVSYGEERPAALGTGESTWSKNRRAEFIVTDGVPMALAYDDEGVDEPMEPDEPVEADDTGL